MKHHIPTDLEPLQDVIAYTSEEAGDGSWANRIQVHSLRHYLQMNLARHGSDRRQFWSSAHKELWEPWLVACTPMAIVSHHGHADAIKKQ